MVPPGETLPAILAARARAATDGRLVLDVVAGMLGALAIAVWHPRLWAFPFSIAICLAMFGTWGILDREIAERVSTPESPLLRALRISQVIAIGIGTVAMTVAGFAILSVAIGTWIS